LASRGTKTSLSGEGTKGAAGYVKHLCSLSKINENERYSWNGERILLRGKGRHHPKVHGFTKGKENGPPRSALRKGCFLADDRGFKEGHARGLTVNEDSGGKRGPRRRPGVKRKLTHGGGIRKIS